MTTPEAHPTPAATALLIATSNPGKVREYQRLLADLPLHITSLQEQGITQDVAETGETFAENARIKAEAYAHLSGLWAWADDSGLEVDALDGRPGIFSARYAGPQATDSANNAKLIAELQQYPARERTARFRCVIALAGRNGAIYTCAGCIEGVIVDEPRGDHGFGYDPHFYLPELGVTMAQLSPSEKNRISHRARAAQQAKQLLIQLRSQGLFP